MEFKDNLYQYRKKKGLSQEELANQCHISRQAISKWENGTAKPDMDNLKALSKALGISIDSLLENEIKETDGTKTVKEIHYVYGWHKEYISKAHIGKIPLIHVNIGKGSRENGKSHVAKGILAIGNYAIGVIAVGALSFGLISIGAISVGLIVALGIISLGTFAAGVLAIGYLAMGALSIGMYAFGTLAIGFELAVGNYAYGIYAIGNRAFGDHIIQFDRTGACLFNKMQRIQVMDMMQDMKPPSLIRWLVQMIGRC